MRSFDNRNHKLQLFGAETVSRIFCQILSISWQRSYCGATRALGDVTAMSRGTWRAPSDPTARLLWCYSDLFPWRPQCACFEQNLAATSAILGTSLRSAALPRCSVRSHNDPAAISGDLANFADRSEVAVLCDWGLNASAGFYNWTIAAICEIDGLKFIVYPFALSRIGANRWHMVLSTVLSWKYLYTLDLFLVDICVMDAHIAKFSMVLYVTEWGKLTWPDIWMWLIIWCVFSLIVAPLDWTIRLRYTFLYYVLSVHVWIQFFILLQNRARTFSMHRFKKDCSSYLSGLLTKHPDIYR